MDDPFEALQAGDVTQLERLLQEDPVRAAARNPQGISLLTLAAYMRRAEVVELLRRHRAEPDFFEAAVLGDVARADELLRQDPSLLARFSPDGFPALSLAAHFGHLGAVEALIAAGADVNAAALNPMRARPLHSAVANRDAASVAAVVATLVAHGADVNARQEGGFVALHEVAARDLPAVARLLLDHGADPDAAGSDGRTPLAVAADKASATARLLLERGATA